jgi:rare lipoprotein A
MKLPVNRNRVTLALTVVLVLGSAAAGPAAARERKAPTAPVSGPAGDYPVTLGEPFEVDGVTYTPSDRLNYDDVGQAAAMEADGSAARISGAHRTLPVPSYVEVTALDSGRTILVRIDQRGPMGGRALVALSPMAWAQLGLPPGGEVPVRVRRVNPPEPERALLRTGQAAPPRMDTPPGLLAALKRKLGLVPPVGDLPVTIRPADVLAAPKPAAALTKPQPVPTRKPAQSPKPALAVMPVQVSPAPTEQPRPASAARLYVQIGAFGQRGNAEAAARKAGGSLVRAGSLWRVRSGPFRPGDEAERGLAKARAAGYAGARIVHD